MSTEKHYVLGSEPAEIARLDAQAASIAEPTRILLRTAGLGPGQRVLDLGCGLGHVSFLVAELVGPTEALPASMPTRRCWPSRSNAGRPQA